MGSMFVCLSERREESRFFEFPQNEGPQKNSKHKFSPPMSSKGPSKDTPKSEPQKQSCEYCSREKKEFDVMNNTRSKCNRAGGDGPFGQSDLSRGSHAFGASKVYPGAEEDLTTC